MKPSNRIARSMLLWALLAGISAGLVGPDLFSAHAAPVKQATMTVIINEVAWGGTAASTNDEWIELYNPGASSVDLTNWNLVSSDNSPNIIFTACVPNCMIPAGGYFLLERTADFTVSDIAANLIYTGALNDTGETLTLYDNNIPSNIIDTANIGAGGWPAGSASPNFYSMERNGVIPDGPTAWVTNVGVMRNGLDAGIPSGCTPGVNCTTDPQPINGTPAQQNWAVTVTITPSPTATSTATVTPTRTPTATATPTGPTSTAAPASPLSVVINEVAWMGTASGRPNDEWIELYNPGTTDKNLNGWTLTIDDGSAEITLASFGSSDVVPAGGFFLLARENSSGNFDIFTDVAEDKSFSEPLVNSPGPIMRLHDPLNTVIDIANSDRGSWPAGSSTSYSSMERRRVEIEGSTTWMTFGGTGSALFAHNRDNILVRGTPKRSNWALTITPTPSPLPPTRVRTPTPKPVGRPIINEYLPRPGFDWNQDGNIDVFDEFIEITNIGPVDINMSGWELDDEEGTGSSPFTLPSITLKPGQRLLFYGLQTNILLSDGGDTVRLLNPNNQVWDAHTYSIAKTPDLSWCRLPEGHGSWFNDCLPTPNLPNTREGVVPAMPDDNGLQPAICNLPDTLPADFLLAECHGYGSNMWRSMFWDEEGWQGDLFVPENTSKWNSFVE